MIVRRIISNAVRVVASMAALVLSTVPVAAGDAETEQATFAAGCFWCIEADLEKVDGVLSVTSGYTGGSVIDPTYRQVTSGTTGHTEAVRVVFDPRVISYEELLDVFWRNIDPTVADQQFCDVGNQYRSAIFYHNDAQRQAAEKSKIELMQSKPFEEPIVTEITAATTFYTAEAYHQDYYKKNPASYTTYRRGCGRDRRLQDLWGEQE